MILTAVAFAMTLAGAVLLGVAGAAGLLWQPWLLAKAAARPAPNQVTPAVLLLCLGFNLALIATGHLGGYYGTCAEMVLLPFRVFV